MKFQQKFGNSRTLFYSMTFQESPGPQEPCFQLLKVIHIKKKLRKKLKNPV